VVGEVVFIALKDRVEWFDVLRCGFYLSVVEVEDLRDYDFSRVVFISLWIIHDLAGRSAPLDKESRVFNGRKFSRLLVMVPYHVVFSRPHPKEVDDVPVGHGNDFNVV